MVQLDFDQFMLDFHRSGDTVIVDKQELQKLLITLSNTKAELVQCKKANAALTKKNAYLTAVQPVQEYLRLHYA